MVCLVVLCCYYAKDWVWRCVSFVLIVYAKTREEAIRKMQAALSELVIEGIEHNSELHMEILSDERFRSGAYTTDFMAKRG